jgi:5,10-methylenetetrahydromethanopterin reductase
MELWATRVPNAATAVAQAQKAEAAGWDGITFTDSQNLVADPFVMTALAAQATERLQFATGVANLHTRHPAALASVAATVQEVSGGRFALGVGRGDTALFHLGLPPMKVAEFADRLATVQAYLSSEIVDNDGTPSRIKWLRAATQPKVPLDLAASGPKVIALAGRVCERITFAVGADPDRLAWAIELASASAKDAGRDPADISFGAYVNVGCHPDLDIARRLIGGGVAAFAHFSSMPGSTGAGLRDEDKAIVADVGRRYDSNQHLRADASHNEALRDDFVDRFAIVGPPETCVERIAGLVELGIERFVVTGASFGSDREHSKRSEQLLVHEVIPSLRERAASA